tara:strand:+ start:907 stop:1101 length:195 start_codon:yes stop_codon:yes gene_type:complete
MTKKEIQKIIIDIPRVRSDAWNDGYYDGRMDYEENCPYEDRPSIVQYLRGYAQGIESLLLEDKQ